MVKERKSVGKKHNSGGSPEQATPAPGASGDSPLRVLEDGSVCVGESCITFGKTATGLLEITVRPEKCGDAGEAMMETLMRGGRGVSIVIPPEGE